MVNEKLSPEDSQHMARLNDFIQACSAANESAKLLLDHYSDVPESSYTPLHWNIRTVIAATADSQNYAGSVVDDIRHFFLKS